MNSVLRRSKSHAIWRFSLYLFTQDHCWFANNSRSSQTFNQSISFKNATPYRNIHRCISEPGRVPDDVN